MSARTFSDRPRVTVRSTVTDPESVVPYMFALMLRNIASDGFVFSDPQAPGDTTRDSKPGCVIAAPSYPADTPGIDEDYVFNWVRDAALTMMEVAHGGMPTSEMLDDYVRFADLCHANARPTAGHACFTIAGESRPWTEQNDGPALQVVTILASYRQLDPDTQKIGAALVNANVSYLLGVYREQTTNLWEEHFGYSFFARAAQLRCFLEVRDTAVPGIDKPAELDSAVEWLRAALDEHWNGSLYVSVLTSPALSGYDPNIDIVQASLYGAVPCTDTRMLATAAQLRAQWQDGYPINQADRTLGIGSLFGRYLADVYDGDTTHPQLGEHPWAVCTCNVAELHYTLAATIRADGRVPLDDLSAPFFAQSGITASTTPSAAADALVATGDAMMCAVLYHSDHLELSEQFDGVTGYERSVRNLTWSYAAYLSAIRARRS